MADLVGALKVFAVASQQKQPELLNDVVSDDARFVIHGQGGISGTYAGVQGVYDMLRTLHEKTDSTMTFAPVAVVQDDNDLFFWAHQTATRPDGRTLDTDISYLYRFKEGKLTEGNMVPTDQLDFDAFFSD